MGRRRATSPSPVSSSPSGANSHSSDSDGTSGRTTTSASDQGREPESDECDDTEVVLNEDVETEDSVDASSDISLVTCEGLTPAASPASTLNGAAGPVPAGPSSGTSTRSGPVDGTN